MNNLKISVESVWVTGSWKTFNTRRAFKIYLWVSAVLKSCYFKLLIKLKYYIFKSIFVSFIKLSLSDTFSNSSKYYYDKKNIINIKTKCS